MLLLPFRLNPITTLFPYTTLFRSPEQPLVAVTGARAWADEDDEQRDEPRGPVLAPRGDLRRRRRHADRKSTRLNSSHRCISYAVFCLKTKRSMSKGSR